MMEVQKALEQIKVLCESKGYKSEFGWNTVRVYTDLHNELSVDFKGRFLDIQQDDEGNEFVKCELRVGVNYPCHGTSPLSEVEKRLEDIRKLVELGKSIQEGYERVEVREIIRTKEECQEDQKWGKLLKIVKGHLGISMLPRGNTLLMEELKQEDVPASGVRTIRVDCKKKSGGTRSRSFEVKVVGNNVLITRL